MLSSCRTFSFVSQHRGRLFQRVQCALRARLPRLPLTLVLPKIHDFDEEKHTFTYSPERGIPRDYYGKRPTGPSAAGTEIQKPRRRNGR